MTTDLIAQLGHLTLGSRLRRTGERLQATTQAYLARNGIKIQVAHLSVLYALSRGEPCGIGDLAETLAMSQPGVTRMVDKLEAGGWVETARRDDDRRQRDVRLSAAGRELVTAANALHWPVIEASVASICSQLDGPLLDQLAGLEAAMARGDLEAELDARTREHGDARP